MSGGLNSFLSSTPAMSEVFSEDEQLRAMTRFEWALTCALETHGLAETGSGAVLEQMLDARFVDLSKLKREAQDAGNIAIPFVRQLTSAVKVRNERAALAIHLGATSQDLLDTALVLQMREAIKLLESALATLHDALAGQVRAHRQTLMTGRTWLQPGPPTTLGLKLAGTLAAIDRQKLRLDNAARGALVLQFGGAVGTLSALHDIGPRVSAELARKLALKEPELPWHAQRDRLVEVVEVLANLTGSLAKFAGDIALLMQAEVGEVSEGEADGRGGSSTMPNKHNPVACAAVVAAHQRMSGLVVTMLNAMPQEHERGVGLWQAEWETVPEAFRLAAAALDYSIEIADRLCVDAKRMRANLDALRGINMAEAVSIALAAKIGKAAAHQILRDASNRAQAEHQHLGAVLKSMPDIRAHLSEAEVDHLLDPNAYLGSARRFIANVLGEPDA